MLSLRCEPPGRRIGSIASAREPATARPAPAATVEQRNLRRDKEFMDRSPIENESRGKRYLGQSGPGSAPPAGVIAARMDFSLTMRPTNLTAASAIAA